MERVLKVFRMKIFVTRRRRKKYRSVMIIEWFDITGFTNIHVYTYTPNYTYNSGLGWGKIEIEEKIILCQTMSILDGAILFECLVIYMCAIAKFPKFDTHSFPFKMWQVFSFCWKYSGWEDEFLKSIHVVTFFTLKGRMAKSFGT